MALRAMQVNHSPFLCWPLSEPADGWAAVEADVEGWLRGNARLEEVPARVCGDRAARRHASDLTVFWDDPLITWQLREIRMGQ